MTRFFEMLNISKVIVIRELFVGLGFGCFRSLRSSFILTAVGLFVSPMWSTQFMQGIAYTAPGVSMGCRVGRM